MTNKRDFSAFDDIPVGARAEVAHTLTSADVQAFVSLSGDNNPIHTDDAFARSRGLGGRVVHGMLTASFISAVIGTKLPGPGALWYEQQLRFVRPVRIGETVRVVAQVIQKSTVQRVLVLQTTVLGDDGQPVIDGEAKVKLTGDRAEAVVPASERDAVVTTPAAVAAPGDRGAIIVSGASRGIGAAVARHLAADGHSIVVNYLRHPEHAEQVVVGIRSSGGRAITYGADVADHAAVQAMVARAIAEFGGIAGVVNNASPPIHHASFEDLRWDEWQRHIDVQLKGAFLLTQAAMPHMVARRAGVVVNIGSIFADNVPPAKVAPYTAVKAALVALTRSLAVEYGPQAVRVNCVSPGMTETDFTAGLPDKVKMLARAQTPMRRLGAPDDVAGVVAFLFSDKAQYVTGQNLRVCGGVVMA